MAYVPPQNVAQLATDLASFKGYATVLEGLRKSPPAGTNPRDLQLLADQRDALKKVVQLQQRRLSRAQKLGA